MAILARDLIAGVIRGRFNGDFCLGRFTLSLRDDGFDFSFRVGLFSLVTQGSASHACQHPNAKNSPYFIR